MKIISWWRERPFLTVAILLAVCLVGYSVAQDNKADEKKVVEVDLNKLPPDLAKEVVEALQRSDQAKPIRLTQAIEIAEKAGKGRAIQAEFDGAGIEAAFTIVIVDADGNRKQVRLDGQGKVLEEKKATRGGPPPGKGPPPGRGLGRGRKPKP